MSYNFWDTIKGNHLADTLTRCLPKLVEKIQYTKRCCEENKFLIIEEEIKKGSSFVTEVKGKPLTSNINEVLLIFEK